MKTRMSIILKILECQWKSRSLIIENNSNFFLFHSLIHLGEIIGKGIYKETKYHLLIQSFNNNNHIYLNLKFSHHKNKRTKTNNNNLKNNIKMLVLILSQTRFLQSRISWISLLTKLAGLFVNLSLNF